MSKKKKKRECAECNRKVAAAQRVYEQFDSMGFRGNPERAKVAEAVLKAIRKAPSEVYAHSVTHVAGLTQVPQSWDE